jgi:uncharacterized membrane protein
MADAIVEELGRSQGPVALGTLITGVSEKRKARRAEVAESVYRLLEEKRIKLEESLIPRSLPGRFFSLRNLTFWGLVPVPLVTGLAILGASLGPVVGDIRVVLGFVTAMFLPGFGAIKALYPKKELTGLQTAVYSTVLSLAMILFVGVVLNYSVFRIDLASIFTSFLVIDLLLLSLASIRRLQFSQSVNLGQIDEKAGSHP